MFVFLFSPPVESVFVFAPMKQLHPEELEFVGCSPSPASYECRFPSGCDVSPSPSPSPESLLGEYPS